MKASEQKSGVLFLNKPQEQVSDHIFLKGRPPVSEFLGFVRGMAVDGQFLNQSDLFNEWRSGNSRINELEKTEAGLADNPPFLDLPVKYNQLAQQVINNPIFQSGFSTFPSRIGMINLKHLLVYQKFINLSYVEFLLSNLGGNPSEELIFKTSLGLNRLDPPVRLLRSAQNAFTFISPSNDFRFLDTIPIMPNELPEDKLNGYPHSSFALVLGYGLNCVNVLSYGGRLILNNGSHRAYAFYKLGFEWVPCVIQEIASKDELEMCGVHELTQNLDRYFKDSRPPMLKDYFDGQLTKIVPVQTKNRMVRIQIGIETSDVPAT